MADSGVKFHPPNPFKITDRTRLENWKNWQKSYRWYASAVNLNQQSHDVQLTAFKSLLGPEALEIYNTFSLLDITDVESVIQKFDEHFKPKVNLILERFKLYRLYQKPGQSFENFLEAVSLQVDKCEFGSMRDDIILYKIVGGLGSDDIRKALLDNVDLNCEKAVQICRASAASHFMSGKLEVSSKTAHKKNDEPNKTPRVVFKRLHTSKNDQKVDTSSKTAKSVEGQSSGDEIVEYVSKKTAQKAKTNSEKGLKTQKLSSSTRKPAKLAHKLAKGVFEECPELDTPSSKKNLKAVLNLEDEVCQGSRPVTRKTAKMGKKQIAEGESDQKLDSAAKKSLKSPEKQLDVVEGDKERSAKTKSEDPNTEQQSEPAPKADESRQNEDGSSDDGGDDWRDADYHVGDDDDDEEELEAPASAAKKKSDAKKQQDGEQSSEPGENREQKRGYHCEVCNEVFTSKRWLTSHRINHVMGKNGEPGEKTAKKEVYPCDVCGKVLTSKSGRFVHRMNHVTEGKLDPGKGKKAIKTYPCGICDRVLASRSGRWKHRLTDHVPGKFYSCYYCGVRTKFKQRMYLRRHIHKMHSDLLGTKPKFFVCDECGYQTHVGSNMKRHKFKHTVEKPLNCELCDYKCIVARQMQMHMSTKHTDQPLKEPIVCTQCPMKFKLPSALKVHMLSHLPPEEREKHRSEMMKDSVFTHPCDVCGKVFTSMTGLRSHRYTHTGEKPFACKECDYKAVQKSSLNVHIKLKHSRETPFICSVCGYACKLKSTLTTHMNVHTGERPYACDQCDSRFKQHAHLITHKKTHTGEKPYVCDICGHRWAQEGNLRAHMKIHRNQSGDPSQYSPPRKRKKKPKNDQPQPPAEPAPAPPSAIPPWSEQVSTINPMECFPSLETPPPFHPTTYPVHQGNPRLPAADCRYFQQRQWPGQNQSQVHNLNQVENHNQVQNQTQHLISIRPVPVAMIRTEMQHP